MDESNKGVYCYANEATFSPQVGLELAVWRTHRVIRGLELSVPPTDLLWGKRSWRLNPMANDLITVPISRSLHRNAKDGFRELPGWWTRGHSGRAAWSFRALSPRLALYISISLFLNPILSHYTGGLIKSNVSLSFERRFSKLIRLKIGYCENLQSIAGWSETQVTTSGLGI